MNKSNDANSQPNLLVRVFRFYRDGFRSMTVGRTLWAIIAVKLVVFFLILRDGCFSPTSLLEKPTATREKRNT